MIKNKKMKTTALIVLSSIVIATGVSGMSNTVKWTDRGVSETDASVCDGTVLEKDSTVLYSVYEDNDLHVYDEDANAYATGMSESRTSGVTQSWKTENGSFDDVIDFEALFGLKITVKDGKASYSAYSHTDKAGGDIPCKLYRIVNRERVFIKDLSSVTTNGNSRSFDIKGLKGIYEIESVFDFMDVKPRCPINFYVSEDRACACRVETACGLITAIDVWDDMLKDADPKDYLSNDDITYPTNGAGRNCNHVKEWEDLSDELIFKDEWTDEAKTFVLVQWLANHIAYDDFRLNDPEQRTRARMANDYTDDNNFTFYNHVGVCWDYMNALVIMCRHQGIPCTSVDNKYHTYNIVWLNGRWVGIDVSRIAKYKCPTKDAAEENWTNNKSPFYCNNYGLYECSMKDYDVNVWTKDHAMGR